MVAFRESTPSHTLTNTVSPLPSRHPRKVQLSLWRHHTPISWEPCGLANLFSVLSLHGTQGDVHSAFRNAGYFLCCVLHGIFFFCIFASMSYRNPSRRMSASLQGGDWWPWLSAPWLRCLHRKGITKHLWKGPTALDEWLWKFHTLSVVERMCIY